MPARLETSLLALFLLVIACSFVGCNDQSSSPSILQASSSSEKDAPAQHTLFGQHCSQCHGQEAQGNREIGAPNLANLSQWYVRDQLSSFQKGYRGYAENDTSGKLMREALKELDSVTLESIILEIDEFASVKNEVTVKGNLQNGKELYREHCMVCHRFNGRGEKVFLSAPLTGQHDWYLRNQLEKFKSGHRGAEKKDVAGSECTTA